MPDETTVTAKITQDRDTLKFLYEKHETSFNTRREFEWRIFVGAVSLMVASDAVMLANSIHPSGVLSLLWIGFCALVGYATVQYQRSLRFLNLRNRQAMDEINNILCAQCNLPDGSLVRVPQTTPERKDLLKWQICVIAAVTLLSVFMPFMIQQAAKQKDKEPNQRVEASILPGRQN